MRWPWDRRRTLSGAAVVTVPAVLATLAFVNPGFPLAQVELNDGAVWLTSTSTLQVGRYNAQVEELNAGLVASSGEFDVLQEAGDVLIVEPGTVSVVDPAGVTAAAEVPVPAGAQVAMGHGTVAVMDADGQVWARTLADLPLLQASTEPPDATVGDGGLVAVTSSGDALAVEGTTGDVTRLTPTAGGDTETAADPGLDGPVDALTTVGEVPVGLDGDMVRTPGGSSTLGMTGPVLQQSGPAASTALVSGTTGLVEVSLSSGEVVAEHEAGGGGTPAAPVRVGTCAHGAWSASAQNYLLLCDGQDPQVMDLEGMTSSDHLVFRVNRQVVALNETVQGRLWLPLEDTQLREPDWADIVPDEQPEDEAEQSQGDRTTQELVPECSPTSAAPHAVDDQFGVRAGRTTLLPVIDNDTSSDCGILAISDLDPLPASFGTMQQVYGGRALQVAVAPDATGSVTFAYSISDGRGTTSPSTAQVTLTVRDPGQDDPPVQDRTGTIRVEQGSTATYPVLADFSDPDGDPLTLVGATAEQGTARFRPDGTLTYVADGGNLGATVVHVSVTDGVSTTEGLVDVDVRAPGSGPPPIDPLHAVTYVDQEVVLQPLKALRSQGAEPPRLAGVEQVAGTTVIPDLDAGTFRFSAGRAGSYYVSFTIAVAPQQVTGLARIDVRERPTEVEPPVAVLDRALLPSGGEVTVAPLENDSDPGGGVLVLQSVSAPDGLRVGVRGHEIVQVSATGVLTGPVTIDYVVSNGAASSTGQILVQPVPASSTAQPPVVPNAVADVRTGGVVTIPVLEDAYDPDGDALTLSTEFAEPLGDGQGLMFVAGDVLRYQAPDTPMTVRATFVVRDTTGNATAATVTVRVHESDAATKAPPRPRELVARVFAGDTVRIAVPLVGIDSDGDGLTLLGVASAGTKGRVTTVGADYLEYEALPGESGTDTFTYAVEDWTGQRAVATVRVGIAARPGDANRVVARDDAVTVRPGQRVEVRVLANDVDVSGGRLSLEQELEVPEGVTAEVSGNRVVVTSSAEGVHPIAYTASNARGARAGAVLTVTVDGDAPVLPPVAQDVVVPPVDTVGRTSVDVDVLEVAQNPSGPLSDLQVSVPSSAADVAQVLSSGKIRVTLTDSAQTVPYLLTNASEPTARSYAFISVPALGFFPPTLRPRAPELRVASGDTLTIPLGEQVQVAPGRTAQVADATAVTATRSDGSPLVVDSTTVRFTPAAGYVGPASITVPVTDATGAGDTGARTSVLTLPITVYTLDDYPPTFNPSPLGVAPGEPASTVDLRAYTQGVEGANGAEEYAYRLIGAAPPGFTAGIDGTRLSVSTAADTPKGTRATLQIELRYGRAGTMTVQVEVLTTASGRRVPVVPPRAVTAVQGQDTVVPILDGAYNPFPETPLRIVGTTVETAGTGSASASGQNVVVRPSADLVGQMVVQVRVRDATNDASREVATYITLQVSGRPEAPRAPRIGEVRDSTVVLSWDAPNARGEEITGYTVTVLPGGDKRSCASTTCTIDGLKNDVEYTFTVAAQNKIGLSDPSPASAVARPDAVPDPPTAPSLEWGDKQVTATWTPPTSKGSPVTSYTAMISPAPPNGPSSMTVNGPTATFRGLANGTAYTVQVQAHNRAPQPSGWSPASAPAVPAAPPDPPTVRAERVGTPLGGQIAVSWQPGAPNGAPITQFELRISGGEADRTVPLGGAETSYAMTDAKNGQQYRFSVRAYNIAGWSSPGEADGLTYGVPGKVTGVDVQASGPGSHAAYGDGSVRISWTPPEDRGAGIAEYQVSSDGGGRWASVGRTTSITLDRQPGGRPVSFQVRAVNQAGVGDPSDPSTPVTPVTRPSQVVGGVTAEVLEYTGRQPTRIRVRWPASDGGGLSVTYDVDASWRSGSVSSNDVDGTATDLAVAVPENGQISIVVRAKNEAGPTEGQRVDLVVPWREAQEPGSGTPGGGG